MFCSNILWITILTTLICHKVVSSLDVNVEKVEHLLKTTDFSFCEGKYSDEDCALKWITLKGTIGTVVSTIFGELQYSIQQDINDEKSTKILLDLSVKTSAWGQKRLEEARKFLPHVKNFNDPALKTRFKIVTTTIASKDPKIRKNIQELSEKMKSTYSSAKACYSKDNCLAAGEKPVNDLYKTLYDYDKLSALWESWQNATGFGLKTDYADLIRLSNIGAKENNYTDAGYAGWFEDFESKTFDKDVVDLYNSVKKLYEQVHAFVRAKMAEFYPDKFDPDGCLPAHILGDLWAQQWTLPNEVYPYPNAPKIDDLTQLHNKFKTFNETVKAAESFFVSIGLSPMVPSFWEKSNFYQPTNKKITKDCHATAYDISAGNDYRITMCSDNNFDDFYTIHHEMGHVEYYMAYSHQPKEFRQGANSAFHEAIGDTIALSVDSFTHKHKLELTKLKTLPFETKINTLFQQALKKVVFLPFSLAVDTFRWNVYNGTISPNKYNEGWWKIRSELGGICPPVDRPATGFDAGSKYHVAFDISYIRYFISFLLQFQFFDTMCEDSGHHGELALCDFYESKQAGKKFKEMLTAGASEKWPKLLNAFTRSSKVSTHAIKKYFKPLYVWLKKYNTENNIAVGWKKREDVLKGVTLTEDNL